MGVRINGVWHDDLADPGGGEYNSAADYNAAAGPASQQGGQNLNWGGGTNQPSGIPSSPTAANPTGNPSVDQNAAMQQYVAAWEKIQNAVAARDERAFQEGLREFDLYWGLDQNKFAEDIRQFNQTLGLNQAALTGVYQGQPTLAAQLQQANLLGTYQGQQTQQAQQQAFTQALEAAGLTGQYQGAPTLQAQNQAFTQGSTLVGQIAGLQANPFRQQTAMGQLQPLLQGRGVAGFGQLGTVPGAGTGGLGYMQQMIDDIKSGGAANTQSVNDTLAAIPTPNKVNSVEFFRSPVTTQNLVLQGMQEKYGIDPNDALQQIKNTMPGFQAPSTFGQVRRAA